MSFYCCLILLFIIASMSGSTKCLPPSCQIGKTILTCIDAGLTQVPDLFNLSNSVEVIDLSYNKINVISNIHVSPDNNIKELILSGNTIWKIYDKAFYNLTRLETLDLSQNGIEGDEITADTFIGLDKLHTLILAQNPIGHLRELAQAFIFALELIELDLEGCELNQVDAIALEDLQSLQRLDMSHNYLTEISSWDFWRLNSLNDLDLSYNRLGVINESDFLALPSLQILDFSYNEIMEISNNALAPLFYMETLNLSYNKLPDVPITSVFGLKTLHVLDLSGNPMQVLEKQPYTDVSDILCLVLNNMTSLKSIENQSLYSFSKLQEVHIAQNRNLSYIHFNTFNPTVFKTIKKVFMNGNNLSSVPGDLLPWTELEQLNLNDNPWQCDIGLCWMVAKKNILKKFNMTLICSSPPKLSGRNILKLTLLDLGCEKKYEFFSYWSVGIGLSLGLTLGIALFLYLLRNK